MECMADNLYEYFVIKVNWIGKMFPTLLYWSYLPVILCYLVNDFFPQCLPVWDYELMISMMDQKQLELMIFNYEQIGIEVFGSAYCCTCISILLMDSHYDHDYINSYNLYPTCNTLISSKIDMGGTSEVRFV